MYIGTTIRTRQVLADMRKSIKLKIVHKILFFLVSNTLDHKELESPVF